MYWFLNFFLAKCLPEKYIWNGNMQSTKCAFDNKVFIDPKAFLICQKVAQKLFEKSKTQLPRK